MGGLWPNLVFVFIPAAWISWSGYSDRRSQDTRQDIGVGREEPRGNDALSLTM